MKIHFKTHVSSLLLILSFGRLAHATYPEALGYSAGITATAQVFASPAIPSLDGEGTVLTPLIGMVTLEADTEGIPDDPAYAKGDGKLDGQFGGLTLTRSGQGDLGYYLMVSGSQVRGDMTSTQNFETTQVKDIRATSYVGSIGVSYRLIGNSKSTFAAGVFGGPAYIQTTSKEVLVQHDGKVTTVTLDTNTPGAYLGFQMLWRLKEWRINPYVAAVLDLSNSCYKPEYEGDSYAPSHYNKCRNGEPGIMAYSSMGGFGLNVGYGRFRIALITAVGASTSFRGSPMSASFGISF